MVPLNCVPSNEEVKKALAPLNAPVCPHLRINDAFVANAYSQVCPTLRCSSAPDCQCPTCLTPTRAGASCKFCKTWIFFLIKTEHSGLETLRLQIIRRFEKISGCTDRAWICNVADPADFML